MTILMCEKWFKKIHFEGLIEYFIAFLNVIEVFMEIMFKFT